MQLRSSSNFLEVGQVGSRWEHQWEQTLPNGIIGLSFSKMPVPTVPTKKTYPYRGNIEKRIRF